MKTKKTNRANLERNRGIFFQIGLILTLVITLLAFQWKTPGSDKVIKFYDDFEGLEGTMIENSYTKVEKPEPPKPEVFEIEIVDNSAKLIDEALNIKNEIGQGESVEFVPVKMKEENYVDDIVYYNPQEYPTFRNGGITEFIKYIQRNIVFGEEARSMQLKGKVTAYFIVNKEGFVTDVKITKGVDPLLDNEVVRVLKQSPRWKPGKQSNLPVKVAFSIPIVFDLRN